MRSRTKALVVIAIAANLALFGSLFFRHQERKRAMVVSQLKAIAPKLLSRLDQQIGELERESTAESVNMLVDVNLYYWPGPPPTADSAGGAVYWGDSIVPLKPEIGQSDVEAICSNRRFCKVIEELGKLNAAKATEMINFELARAINEYAALYDSEMKRQMPYYKLDRLAGQSPINGPGFVTGNVAKGKIVIAGVRLKVLSLVWIAGALKLPGCRSNITQVARLAMKQRDDLYADPSLHVFFKKEMLRLGSLYNRQILTAAMLGIIPADAQQTLMNDLGLHWVERKIVSYKAVLTKYDLPIRSGGMSPDYSHGTWAVKCVSPLDDSQYDRVMKQCGMDS